MAASSPDLSTKVGESLIANAAVNGNLKPLTFDTPKQNLRGLNKPKCSKCGNVARSRCPFQSCKSCCAKAQNPCPIHVLKQSSTLPDRPPPSTISSSEQLPTDAPLNGATWRLTSLRQLSTAVANSLRARKALTRKDAININKWRFSKLREHIQGDIEVESEAFDRYLHNVSLLEELFSTTLEEKIQKLVASMKAKLKSNPKRADSIRKKTMNLVHEKLRELQEREVSVDDDELDAYRELKRPKKLDEARTKKTMETDGLIDKLKKARTKDELFGLSNGEVLKDLSAVMEKEFESDIDLSYDLPKICSVVHIDQAVISYIDAQISSVSQLAEL